MNRYLCSRWPALYIPPTILFVRGVFDTSDPEIIAIVEKSESFVSGHISVLEVDDPNAVTIEIPGEETPPDSSPAKYLSQLNKSELLAKAADLGISDAEDMTRDELYAAVKADAGT